MNAEQKAARLTALTAISYRDADAKREALRANRHAMNIAILQERLRRAEEAEDKRREKGKS